MRYLTIAQAAQRLGICRQSVWKAYRAGKLSACREPHTGILLIPEEELARYRPRAPNKRARPTKEDTPP